MASTNPTEVHIKLCRLAFPSIFQKVASQEGGKPKYKATLLLDPENPKGTKAIEDIKKAAKALAKTTWKDKADQVYKKLERDGDRFPIGDDEQRGYSSEGEKWAGFEGMMVVNAKNDRRPQVLDRDGSAVAEEDDLIHGGDYVYAIVRLYAIADAKRGGNGIFVSLEAIKFKKEGERFGAGDTDYTDAFEDDDDDDDDDDLI